MLPTAQSVSPHEPHVVPPPSCHQFPGNRTQHISQLPLFRELQSAVRSPLASFSQGNPVVLSLSSQGMPCTPLTSFVVIFCILSSILTSLLDYGALLHCQNISRFYSFLLSMTEEFSDSYHICPL